MLDEETLAPTWRREFRGAIFSDSADHVAREEPLEIRIAGVPIAVTMRTPGNDEELVRGFLTTERVMAAADIASVRPCTDSAEDNVVLVVPRAGVELDLARLKRNFYASSSCGVCGKATLDGALACAPPLPDGPVVPASLLYELPARLRAEQETFAATGGLHAAGLFSAAGELLCVREDVGRHNAVDKVIGWAAMHGVAPAVLLVSGRVAFEIVQKTLAARIPILAAVSAPTSLAVDLAERANVTLCGFLRGERVCIYSAPTRIASL
jgi:FdhD protein